MITRKAILEVCPSCEAVNYVYLGDITTANAVSVECWQCKRKWIVLSSEKHINTNNAFVVDGEPSPR